MGEDREPPEVGVREAYVGVSGREDVLLDLSRDRCRRLYSAACGNRGAVAAYRARQSR